MALHFFLYNNTWTKRRDSTKKPVAADAAYSCNGDFLAPFNLTSPTFVFDLLESPMNALYKNIFYIWCDTVNRYYYVQNWSQENGLLYADCSIDALASYREDIIGSTFFVTRSSNPDYYNQFLSDTRYPQRVDKSTSTHVSTESYVTPTVTDATFLIAIVGSGVKYYATHYTGMQTLVNYLFSDDFYETILGSVVYAAHPEYKMTVDPMQYISSCKLLPVKWAAVNTYLTSGGLSAQQTINIGGHSCDIGSAYFYDVAPLPVYGYSEAFTFDDHPQKASRGPWLQYSNTTYEMFVPAFGIYNLDQYPCALYGSAGYKVTIDLRTGTARLIIDFGAGLQAASIVDTESALGIDWPVSQIMTPGTGIGTVANSFLSTVASVAAGDVGGAVSGIVSGVETGIKNAIPTVSQKGSIGAITQAYYKNAWVRQWFTQVTAEDVTHNGRPCFRSLPLSSFRNCYVECYRVKPEFNATGAEMDMIVSALESGVYLE